MGVSPSPRGNSVQVQRHGGFTLIELMMVVLIAAILLGVGVPSFRSLIQDNRLKTHADVFVTTMNLARSEAIARNATVTVCSTSNGTGCSGTWSTGWIVFADVNGNGAVDAGDEVIRAVTNVPTGVQVLNIANNATIRFNSRGYRVDATGAVSVQFQDVRGATKCRAVDVNLIGRAGTRTNASGQPTCS